MDWFSAMFRLPRDFAAADDTDPPKSCLLDRKLFVGSGTNATTAQCSIRDLKGDWPDITIQVTLFVANPPGVSYILAYGTQFTNVPVVIATYGGLALLGIPYSPKSSPGYEYFVYQPGTASLKQISQPDGTRLTDDIFAAGLLPHGGGGSSHYHVTALVMGPLGEIELHLYSSKTQSWTTKRPVFTKPDDNFVHMTNKVIPVGSGCDGGAMVAFVDIWSGILFCDVLDGDQPRLHHVPLPSTKICRNTAPRVTSVFKPRDVVIDDVPGDNSSLRIRFAEVVSWPIFESWRATFWTATTTATSPWRLLKEWHNHSDYGFSDSELTVANDIILAALLPEEPDSDDDDPTQDDDYPTRLGSLYVDMPILSLQQDNVNVVRFIAKRYMMMSGVWLISVDMANKELLGVSRLPRSTVLSYSTISTCLSWAAGAGPKGHLKLLNTASPILTRSIISRWCHPRLVNKSKANHGSYDKDGLD